MFLSNNAGGILGGISTGQPVVVRFAVKPTSSILTPRRTVDRYGGDAEISTKGRHDPCVGIRAVPIGEAMMACVLADHYLRQRGQVGETPAWPFREAAQLRKAMKWTKLTSASKMWSPPSPGARSWSSPMTTTARTRAICSSPRRSARRRRWPSSSATRPASCARRSPPEEAKRLHLDPMVALNDAPLGTAFTVSVDVRHGLTTGISAEERNNTVRALANRNSGANDFVRPGHVFPLVASEGGVLMRSGHTEACVDLCRLAGSAAGRRARRTDERRRHRDARARRSPPSPRSTSSSASRSPI